MTLLLMMSRSAKQIRFHVPLAFAGAGAGAGTCVRMSLGSSVSWLLPRYAGFGFLLEACSTWSNGWPHPLEGGLCRRCHEDAPQFDDPETVPCTPPEWRRHGTALPDRPAQPYMWRSCRAVSRMYGRSTVTLMLVFNGGSIHHVDVFRRAPVAVILIAHVPECWTESLSDGCCIQVYLEHFGALHHGPSDVS